MILEAKSGSKVLIFVKSIEVGSPGSMARLKRFFLFEEEGRERDFEEGEEALFIVGE